MRVIFFSFGVSEMLIVEDSCEFVGTRFFFCFRFLEKKKKVKSWVSVLLLALCHMGKDGMWVKK